MIARETGRQSLDGHFALQAQIASKVNLSHAAATQQRNDFEIADLVARF